MLRRTEIRTKKECILNFADMNKRTKHAVTCNSTHTYTGTIGRENNHYRQTIFEGGSKGQL